MTAQARRDALWGYLFIAPQMLGFLLFVIGPLVAVFVFSTQDRNLLTGIAKPVGFDNYVAIFSKDALFQTALVNSLTFTALLVPMNIGLALFLAMMLSQRIAGITIFRVLFFSPVVTSAVAWAVVWRFMLQGEQGTINQVLAIVGIKGPNWLREPSWAMLSVVVTLVLKNVGLNMVILLAAITNLPTEYREAAMVDGANRRKVFTRITLPLLAPTLLFVTVITVIGSLRVFDHIMLMTQGGPANATLVLVYYVYYTAFQAFKTGYASALAAILFVIALILTLAQFVLRGKASQV
ncbi:MAG: sugar ABC transporter permease [Anaerolineae bacterium]|nr:sugar ABC transporter permease [Anaerolineae bacterium]